MANNAAKIENQENVIASGLKSVTIDGVTSTYRDLPELRSILRQLRDDDDATVGKRRPAFSTIRTGGF